MSTIWFLQGDWSDEWTGWAEEQALRERLIPYGSDDGVFWISFSDLCKYEQQEEEEEGMNRTEMNELAGISEMWMFASSGPTAGISLDCTWLSIRT